MKYVRSGVEVGVCGREWRTSQNQLVAILSIRCFQNGTILDCKPLGDDEKTREEDTSISRVNGGLISPVCGSEAFHMTTFGVEILVIEQ